MTKIFTIPFAESGDTITIPDTIQGNGSISFPSGWGQDYEKANNDPNYKPVGRKEMNQILFQITEAIQEMQFYGYAKWQNISGGWPKDARVLYNGIIYVNTSNGNTSTPPAGNWKLDTDFSPYVNKDGSVAMTAPLSLSGNVSGNLHAVPYQQVLSMVNQAVPPGLIAYWPVTSLPSGWVKCNGGTLNRAGTYANLYNVIGTTYGSTSGSNFKVPDFRGRFIRVWDDGAGVDTGRNLGSNQADQNKQHNHGGKTGGQSANHTHTGTTEAGGVHNHAASTASAGNHNHTLQLVQSLAGTVKRTDHSGWVQRETVNLTTSTAGAHTHTVTVNNSVSHTHTFTTGNSSGNHTHSISEDGGNESRPVNTALMAIIKY